MKGLYNYKYNVCTVTDVGHYVYDRSKRWLLNIQRCDIEKTTVEYRRQNIRVCQDHFTIHSFMTPDKTTLTWNAEPTLFRGAIENAMKLIPHQRSLPTCSTSACPFVRMPVREHNDHSYYRTRSKDEAKNKKRIYFVWQVASWEDVKQFYLADCRLSVKLAPKLTSEHIYLPPFSPMRVRTLPVYLPKYVCMCVYLCDDPCLN